MKPKITIEEINERMLTDEAIEYLISIYGKDHKTDYKKE